MTTDELIRDNGLLSSEDLNFSLPETFEEIYNLLKTIKEYREYANPDSIAWAVYIEEVFHILGFNTEKIEQRLIILKVLESGTVPKAIVGLISSDENEDKIGTWLDWRSLLLFVASHYKVDWGVLTNGFELKFFDFRRNDNNEIALWVNLEEIVERNRLDSFFAIYKLFSFIKGKGVQPVKRRRAKVGRPYHRSENLNDISLPKGLIHVLNIYTEVIINGLDFSLACKVIAERNGLRTPLTVADACTRKIGLKTDDFRRLLENKQEFITYITTIYPSFSEEIIRTTENTASADQRVVK